MTTKSIELDLDLLNELFDNQKKLDDLLLDDESFLGDSMSFGNGSSGGSDLDESLNIVDFSSHSSSPFDSEDLALDQSKQKVMYFYVPMVLEVVAIVYGLMYLI